MDVHTLVCGIERDENITTNCIFTLGLKHTNFLESTWHFSFIIVAESEDKRKGISLHKLLHPKLRICCAYFDNAHFANFVINSFYSTRS